MDQGTVQEMSRYHETLSTHDRIIRTALGVYVERMERAAAEAEAAYNAGQADPEVKARQDASLMTNYGLKVASQRFQQSAESGRKALNAILDAVLGPEDDENER
ncbi:hypothetical protein ACG2OD_14655 [Streptomyces sp. PDY-4]|uniref:hypothetical protein n=1 Tax=Streptomyces sp. PDY-4 TaxID=3376070 RepID=UPI0037AADAE4